jgi:hypothetical protein
MGQTLDAICMPTMVIQFSKFCPGQVSSLSLSLCPPPPAHSETQCNFTLSQECIRRDLHIWQMIFICVN